MQHFITKCCIFNSNMDLYVLNSFLSVMQAGHNFLFLRTGKSMFFLVESLSSICYDKKNVTIQNPIRKTVANAT